MSAAMPSSPKQTSTDNTATQAKKLPGVSETIDFHEPSNDRETSHSKRKVRADSESRSPIPYNNIAGSLSSIVTNTKTDERNAARDERKLEKDFSQNISSSCTKELQKEKEKKKKKEKENGYNGDLSIMRAHKELEALSLRTRQGEQEPENYYDDDGGTVDAQTRLLLTRKGFPPAIWALLGCFPDNEGCMDCGTENPDWACVNWGTLICYRCSIEHRQLGAGITVLRSMSKDSWNLFQVVAMLEGGNGRLAAFFDGSNRRSSNNKSAKGANKTLVELQQIRDAQYKHKNSVKYQRDLGQRAASACASHGCPISFDGSTLVDR